MLRSSTTSRLPWGLCAGLTDVLWRIGLSGIRMAPCRVCRVKLVSWVGSSASSLCSPPSLSVCIFNSENGHSWGLFFPKDRLERRISTENRKDKGITRSNSLLPLVSTLSWGLTVGQALSWEVQCGGDSRWSHHSFHGGMEIVDKHRRTEMQSLAL